MKKPRLSEVKWDLIYSKNGLSVYANSQDIYSDFYVKLNGAFAKRFYGETAWMDVTRFAHDQAMEFWDFNIDENILVLVFCGLTISTAFDFSSSLQFSGKNKSGRSDSKFFKKESLSLNLSMLPIKINPF